MKELNKKKLQRLKATSKNWTEEQWEGYLLSLDQGCSESLIDPRKYNRLKEACETFPDYIQKEEYTQYLSKLKPLLNKLTFKQKTVIRMFFWEGLSEVQIAKKLCLSTSSVKDRKSNGLRKLKSCFLGHIPPTSPIVRGKVFFNSSKPMSQSSSLSSDSALLDDGGNCAS